MANISSQDNLFTGRLTNQLFIKDVKLKSFLNLSQKIYIIIVNLEERTIPPTTFILHGSPFDLCEADGQIFISVQYGGLLIHTDNIKCVNTKREAYSEPDERKRLQKMEVQSFYYSGILLKLMKHSSLKPTQPQGVILKSFVKKLICEPSLTKHICLCSYIIE